MLFGFILGFLSGLLTAIGLFSFLAYWLCTRSNHLALARFIYGIAQALASLRPKSAGPSTTADNGKAIAVRSAN